MKYERDAIRAKLFELGYDEQAADSVMASYDRQIERLGRNPVTASAETAPLPEVHEPEPVPEPAHPAGIRVRDIGSGPPRTGNEKPIPNPNRPDSPTAWRRFLNVPGTRR